MATAEDRAVPNIRTTPGRQSWGVGGTTPLPAPRFFVFVRVDARVDADQKLNFDLHDGFDPVRHRKQPEASYLTNEAADIMIIAETNDESDCSWVEVI